MGCSYWLAGCVYVRDFGACVCTCVSCLSSGIGFGVDPGPALPLHAVYIDRRQTPGRSPRSVGLSTLETHTSTDSDVHTSTHTSAQTQTHTKRHKHIFCGRAGKPSTLRLTHAPLHLHNRLQLYSSPSALHHQPFGGIYPPIHPSNHPSIDCDKLT